MAGQKPLLTEVGIHHRLERCHDSKTLTSKPGYKLWKYFGSSQCNKLFTWKISRWETLVLVSMADVTHLSCSLTPALEESRMALILMFIVVTYMVTNTPRMILNFYEFLVSEQRQKDKHCHIHPRWELLLVVIRKNLTEISEYFPRLIQNSFWCNSKYFRWIAPLTMLSMLMLTFNSSVNLFIYCFCNKIFRYDGSLAVFRNGK